MPKKVIGTIRGEGKASFFRNQIECAINMHFLKSPHCNKVLPDGKIVPKKHRNMSKVIDANKNMIGGAAFNVDADVFDDGSIGNFRIV